MRNMVCVFTAALAAAGLGSGAVVRAEQPIATFKSSVALVPISAVVRDGRGRLVTTLTAGDFEVLDKGERRRIVDFQIDTTGAVTAAVMVDMSGSMRIGPKMDVVRDLLKRLSAGLQNGRDEASLFTFDAGLREAQPFSVRPASFETTLTGQPWGTTSLYDGIAETARRLQARPAQRRAIIVLTDGVDTSSGLSAPEVSALASSVDVPVYVVATVPPIDRPAGDGPTAAGRSNGDLLDLARWTGGDLFWVSDAAEAAATTERILSELRHQYVIAIEASSAAEWRPLEVRVRRQRLTVRTRGGYYSRAQ